MQNSLASRKVKIFGSEADGNPWKWQKRQKMTLVTAVKIFIDANTSIIMSDAFDKLLGIRASFLNKVFLTILFKGGPELIWVAQELCSCNTRIPRETWTTLCLKQLMLDRRKRNWKKQYMIFVRSWNATSRTVNTCSSATILILLFVIRLNFVHIHFALGQYQPNCEWSVFTSLSPGLTYRSHIRG